MSKALVWENDNAGEISGSITLRAAINLLHLGWGAMPLTKKKWIRPVYIIIGIAIAALMIACLWSRSSFLVRPLLTRAVTQQYPGAEIVEIYSFETTYLVFVRMNGADAALIYERVRMRRDLAEPDMVCPLRTGDTQEVYIQERFKDYRLTLSPGHCAVREVRADYPQYMAVAVHACIVICLLGAVLIGKRRRRRS